MVDLGGIVASLPSPYPLCLPKPGMLFCICPYILRNNVSLCVNLSLSERSHLRFSLLELNWLHLGYQAMMDEQDTCVCPMHCSQGFSSKTNVPVQTYVMNRFFFFAMSLSINPFLAIGPLNLPDNGPVLTAS